MTAQNLIAKARASFKEKLSSDVSFDLGDTYFKKGRLELESDGCLMTISCILV